MSARTHAVALALTPLLAMPLTGTAQVPQALTALDYIEIQQLVSKYARAIDTCSNNGYDYADLYTADGIFMPMVNGRSIPGIQGRERLAEVSGGGASGCVNVPWIEQGVRHIYSNHIITASPEGATGTVDMMMIGLDGDPYKIAHDGYYEDIYVRTPEGWRFRQRTHHARLDAGQPIEQGNASGRTPNEATLVADRLDIHDLFVDYYAQIGTNDHDYSRFFASDGVLEVNGLMARGIEAIAALYDQAGGGAGEATPAQADIPPGTLQMLFSNLKVDVQGDTAVATLMWRSVESDTLIAAPSVTEYGRERTELVRQPDGWRIGRRVVTSEGGLPAGLLPTYERR